MASNHDISRLFDLFAELLYLHGRDERLAGLLTGASYRVSRLPLELTDMPPNEIKTHLRPELARLVKELEQSGTIAVLDELVQLTPAGLFELMRIRGLGGKKIAVLWKIAKIDSLDKLAEAARKDEISTIKGFGKKTQANILAAIDAYRSNVDRYHYASVADSATGLISALQKSLKTELVSLCGEIRRQSLTVASIDIIAAVGLKKLSPKAIGRSVIFQSTSTTETKGHTIDEIPVHIFHTTKEKFFLDLFMRTGSAAHVEKIKPSLKASTYPSEEAIYKQAKLNFIVPEIREDLAEWTVPRPGNTLITPPDIRGVVHNHTTYSDGVDTLQEFVSACKSRNFEYVVISDHSKNAHYAGGLKEEKLASQMKEIDLLQKKFKDIHIFKSIECDILVSGDLDYSPSILKKLDLVIVSVHQLLKMDEDKATRRLIKAIENPYTTILGHMTGRQLLIRPGYPINFPKVIDACAANNVIIEINANPYRLDMDWTHIPYALKKGVMISINPDAHSIPEIDNIRWGVYAARKGGLTKDMTWNAMSLTDIKQWLKKYRPK